MKTPLPHGAAPIPLAILAMASFLSLGGARVIDPLLQAIAQDFDTSVPAVSVLITAFALPYALNQILLGPLGDRFGKLRVLLGALGGYTLATGACALAPDLATLTLLRAAAGAASAGLIPVALAYIGDAVPYDQRQVTISRFLLGGVMALLLAGPIGGVFGEYLGWRRVFVLLSAAGLVLTLALARRMRHLPDRRDPTARFNGAAYMALLRSRTAVMLLLAALLDGMLLGGCFPFIAPFLHAEFGLSYAGSGLVVACYGIGALIYTRNAKALLGRWGESGLVLRGGMVIAAALLAGMAVPDWPAFVLAQVALGLGFFMLHSVLQARATEMLPQARSSSVAAFVAALFIGQGLGAVLMGVMIDAAGYRVAFRIDAVLIIGLAVWLHRQFGATRTPPRVA